MATVGIEFKGRVIDMLIAIGTIIILEFIIIIIKFTTISLLGPTMLVEDN